MEIKSQTTIISRVKIINNNSTRYSPDIKKFDRTTKFQNAGTQVTLTCTVSQKEDMVPEITWRQEDTTETTGCIQGGWDSDKGILGCVCNTKSDINFISMVSSNQSNCV